MKEILQKWWGLFFILVLLGSNLSVYATEGTVSEVSLYHAHSGSTSGGGCYTKPEYHSHAGDTVSGGSCYTPVYHTHQGDVTNGGSCYGSKKCGGTMITPYGSHYIHKCTICGFEYEVGTVDGEGHTVPATPGKVCNYMTCPKVSYYLDCAKTNTIEYYQLSCKKDETTIEGYSIDCGKTPSTVVGKIQLNKASGTEYRLSISASNAVINSSVWNTGESGQSILVTGNKEYTCQVAYSVEGRSETAVLRYNVTDYDTSGPNVTVSYDDGKWEQSKTITITAVDAGVGLHNMAYRYSNGTIWSDWSNSASYQIKANGTYSVEVRDAVGNITKKTFTITHIGIAPDNIPDNSTNNIKPDKEEKVPVTTKLPSKENENKKEEKEVVVVETETIEVKSAMSEPEKEEVVYQTITATEDMEKAYVIKENPSVETSYVQRTYDENITNEVDDNEYSQMACAVGVIGVPFLFFGCMGNTKIYSVSEQGKRKFLCRAFLNKKGKLKISRFYLKKNKSNTILIKPNKSALEKKRGKNVSIRIGERNFSKQIQEEILLEY